MVADVISIGAKRRACWSLLEIARPGQRPVPYGILLVDRDTGELTRRLRDPDGLAELDEPELDILSALPGDLDQKAREIGGLRLIEWLEDSLSGFFRIGGRASIVYNDANAAADRLFEDYVVENGAGGQSDSEVRPFVTHLPLYGMRAAATKFGEGFAEGMDAGVESWVRAPENLRLTEGMFAAHVVGRSMEPLIPDGGICIFRAPVTGSRNGRYLLIEKFGETDFASRYTVKRYARRGVLVESAAREGPIRLEPLNREFEAFDLTGDDFRVVAEFVQVLPS